METSAKGGLAARVKIGKLLTFSSYSSFKKMEREAGYVFISRGSFTYPYLWQIFYIVKDDFELPIFPPLFLKWSTGILLNRV